MQFDIYEKIYTYAGSLYIYIIICCYECTAWANISSSSNAKLGDFELFLMCKFAISDGGAQPW